jgi:predicted XRE-type DNA-binding protein
MSKWPTKKQINAAMAEIDSQPSSKPLSEKPSPIETLKHSICAQFVIYMQTHQLSQKELAEKLKIDKALMSKIVHYQYDEFTIDRLIKYLFILDPKVKIEVKARVA